MKKTARYFILLVCFLSSVTAIANPVRKVYRADSRAPDEIFNRGFFALGTNINFNSHVIGVSGCRGSRDSAFIPTTSSLTAAQRFSIDLMNASENRMSYIYHIRPTRNFYSALTTMYYIYDYGGANRFVPAETRAVLAREQEYSAYQSIPPQLIESVTIYHRRDDGSTEVTTRTNPNFIRDNTHTNENPFTYGMPYPINVTPLLVMGPSMTNINNEMAGAEASLPSPSFSVGSLFTSMGTL